jgi:L-lysine 2,3-aminomutase
MEKDQNYPENLNSLAAQKTRRTIRPYYLYAYKMLEEVRLLRPSSESMPPTIMKH